jgi:hypothetical protein
MSPLPRRQFAPTFALLVGLSGLALFTLGCAGDLDPRLKTGSGGSTGTCDAAPLMMTKCGQLGCHSNMSPQAGLDLLSAGVATRLKAAPMPGMNASCTDSLRTAYLGPASNPAMGFLFQKMMPNTPPCGSPMPQLGTTADTACLTEWATAVANGTIQ